MSSAIYGVNENLIILGTNFSKQAWVNSQMSECCSRRGYGATESMTFEYPSETIQIYQIEVTFHCYTAPEPILFRAAKVSPFCFKGITHAWTATQPTIRMA